MPIAHSAPHIYLSALPFAPKKSMVPVYYMPMFKNSLSIKMGQEINWPARMSVFEGHNSYVFSVACSPDGKHIVSGSHDNTICVWDAEMGQVVTGPLKGHNGSVQSVAYSPDGKHIVSGSDDKMICVWDAETGHVVTGPLKGHNDSVLSVAYSPDGKNIVSGSHDNTICVWDAETGQVVTGPLKGHNNSVWSGILP